MELGDSKYRAGKRLHEERLGLTETLAEAETDAELGGDRADEIASLKDQIAKIDSNPLYTEFTAFEVAAAPKSGMPDDAIKTTVGANLTKMKQALLEYLVQVAAFPECETNLPPHVAAPLHPDTGVPLPQYNICSRCTWIKNARKMKTQIDSVANTNFKELLDLSATDFLDKLQQPKAKHSL